MVNHIIRNTARALGFQMRGAIWDLVERGIPRGLNKENAGIYTYYDLHKEAVRKCKECSNQ